MACCPCCCTQQNGVCCGTGEEKVCCKAPRDCCTVYTVGVGESDVCCGETQYCCNDGQGVCCEEGQICCVGDLGAVCCESNVVCCAGVCCAEGECCVDDACVPCAECETDEDCPEGECCNGGVCGECPECVENEDCPEGECCVDGQCVERECDTGLDCDTLCCLGCVCIATVDASIQPWDNDEPANNQCPPGWGYGGDVPGDDTNAFYCCPPDTVALPGSGKCCPNENYEAPP